MRRPIYGAMSYLACCKYIYCFGKWLKCKCKCMKCHDLPSHGTMTSLVCWPIYWPMIYIPVSLFVGPSHDDIICYTIGNTIRYSMCDIYPSWQQFAMHSSSGKMTHGKFDGITNLVYQLLSWMISWMFVINDLSEGIISDIWMVILKVPRFHEWQGDYNVVCYVGSYPKWHISCWRRIYWALSLVISLSHFNKRIFTACCLCRIGLRKDRPGIRM